MKNIGTPIPDNIKQVIGEQDADRLQEMATALVQCGDSELLYRIADYFYDLYARNESRYKRS